MSVHTNNTNLNPYSNTPIKNLEYIQNKALVIAPFEITKSGLIDTDLMLDTPGFITMYFFRKNFNSVLKEPTAEQFKVVGTVSDIGTKLGLDITTSNISSSITNSYYLGSTKIAVTFKYDKNTGIRTIEKDNTLLTGDYTDISIDSTCDLTTEDYFVICNVTKNTKATNSSFTESSSMDFIFMIPSDECQEIITDFDILDSNNQTINVKKYGTLGSGFVADNDTTIKPAYEADFFGDGSNIATYLFDGTCEDLNGNYNGTATGVTYGEGKVGQAAVFNGSASTGILTKNYTSSEVFAISLWINASANGASIYTRDSNTIGKAFGLYLMPSGKFIFQNEYVSGSYITLTSNYTVTLNTWVHIYIERVNNTTKLYINGVLDNTSVSNNWNLYAVTLSQYPMTLGKRWSQGSTVYPSFTGKIDQVRIFNRALNQNEVTALYLNNGSTRVIKQESNVEQLTLNEVTGKTLIPNGNPLVVYDRDIGPSIKFDGSSYYTIPSSNDFSFGIDNFTVEGYFYLSSSTSWQKIISITNPESILLGWYDNKLSLDWNNSATSYLSYISGTFNTNTWYHVAVVREGTKISLFIGGNLIGSTTIGSLVLNSSIDINIGLAESGWIANFQGSISQLHIIKGIAKYTTNFTPASRLVQTPNTVLLLQVDKPIINTNNWTKVQLESVEAIPTLSIVEQTGKVLTNTGITTVNDTYKNNDGSLVCAQNKSISLSSTSDLILGTNDFTIELWCKWNGNGTLPVTGTQYTMFNNLLSGSNKCWDIQYYNGAYRFSPYTSGWGLTFTKDMDNNWHHIAIEKYNNTLTMYFDGVTAVSSTTLPNLSDTSVLYIGNTSYTSMENAWNGYLDDIRITNGRARYQKDFTPPTTSLVKDANTVFLLQAKNPNIQIKDPKRKDFFGDKSMVACYMLDSNANDETGSYNGTATNITYTDGKFGKCAAGNGISSEINVSGLSIISSRTVSFWVKSNYTTVNNCAIFSSRDTGDDYLEGIVIRAGNGTLSSFIINIGVNTFDINPLDLNWNNIIIVDDTINYNVYFNGVLKITQPVQSGHKKMSSFNLFRRSGTPAPQFFDGQIDNVKIFNRALNQNEVTALYNEVISPVITLEPETETIASEPDFFNDKSNIATYLFEPEILSTKYTIDKAIFEAPKSSSGNFTFFGYLQFWYNNQSLDIKAYLVNRNNARLELDGVVIGNLNQDNVWYSDNDSGDWNPNNIIKSSINNGSGTTNNSAKQTITVTFSKDIKIDNISYVSYLSRLPGGSNIKTTLLYKGTQLFTNTDTTQYSTTHNLIPNTVKEANGKYNGNGTGTGITYATGKFGQAIALTPSSTISAQLPNIAGASFSISMWVLDSSFAESFKSLWYYGDGSVKSGFTSYHTLANTIGIDLYSSQTYETPALTIKNEFIHVTWVISNPTLASWSAKIYINGVSQTLTQTRTSTNIPAVTGFLFGLNGYDNTAIGRTTIKVDNVRIFNRPLTASEVQDLYKETKRVKYKAITLDNTNFGPAAKFNIETQKEIKLLNYKTWTGTDATSQGYRIYPVMKLSDHTAEETTFSPKFYLGAKYQRNLAEVLLPSIKSKRTISNLKDMYLVDDLCIQTLKKINILLENNQLIKFTERLYNLATPLREKLNADLILEYLSTPVTGSVNSDIAATLKTSLIEDYHFTQEEIDNLNDNLNTFKSRARMNISTPIIQGTNGSLDQVKFSLPKTFVDGNRSKTEKKNLLIFGTDAGFNKFGLSGYTTPYSNVTKRDASSVLNISDLTNGLTTLNMLEDISTIKDVQQNYGDETINILFENGNLYAGRYVSTSNGYAYCRDGNGISKTNFGLKLIKTNVKSMVCLMTGTFIIDNNNDVWGTGGWASFSGGTIVYNGYDIFGINSSGYLPSWTKIFPSSTGKVPKKITGMYSTTFILTESGEVFGTGALPNWYTLDGISRETQTWVSLGTGVSDINCGDAHIVYTMQNGDIYSGSYSNLSGLTIQGNNSTSTNTKALKIITTWLPTGTNIVKTECTNQNVYFLLSNGDVYGAGLNRGGQLQRSPSSGTSGISTPIKLYSNVKRIIPQLFGRNDTLSALMVELNTGEIKANGETSVYKFGYYVDHNTGVTTPVTLFSKVDKIFLTELTTIAIINGVMYLAGYNRVFGENTTNTTFLETKPLIAMPGAFKDILTNYKQQIPFSYIPLSTDPANTNNEPVFENLTDITGFNHSEIVIDLPNVL